MKRLLLPIGAIVVVAALTLGAGRAFLDRTDSRAPAQPDAAHAEHGSATGIGLAPAPVVNPPATAARLAVSVRPLALVEQGYSLEARVTTPDGKPAADLPVKFFELVELFGQREMLIGSGTTDGRGIVAYGYLPARTGEHAIVVRSTGRDRTLSAGEGRATFNAQISAAVYQPIRSNLAAFSDKVPYAAGLLVLGVWGLIAFALFGTARGVIAGARETTRKGGTA